MLPLHKQLPVPQEVRSCQDSALGQAPGEVASRWPQGDRATESHVGTSGRWPGRRSGAAARQSPAGTARSQDPRGHGEDGAPEGGEAPRQTSRKPFHTRSPAGPSAQRCHQPQWAAPSGHRHQSGSPARSGPQRRPTRWGPGTQGRSAGLQGVGHREVVAAFPPGFTGGGAAVLQLRAGDHDVAIFTLIL